MLPVITILIIVFKVVIAFSILILIHELGHFLIAKKSGVLVEEFGLGLPPRLFGKKIGETIYSLNWLPIGGFVKLHGETSSEKIVHPKRAFTNKKPLTKIAITLAGIIMNFFLAIICFAVIFFFLGLPGKINLQITSIAPDSPASSAALQQGDLITKINGIVLIDDIHFKDEITKFKGKATTLTVLRRNEELTVDITPRVNPPTGQGALGVEFTSSQESYFPPIWQRPFLSILEGTKQTINLSKAVVFGLGSAAQSVGQGKSPEGVSGPVGILAIFRRIADLGILPLVNLVGVISINLAIVNLIPFPPLDGSRIALIIAEKLTKRKMTPKIEEKVYLVGFAVLIGLMILITSKEIPALITSGSLSNYADTLLNPK